MRSAPTLQEVRKSFDLAAGRYKFLKYTLHERARRIHGYLRPGDKVLDVGVASAELVVTYARNLDLKLVGLDVSGQMLLQAKDKQKVSNLAVGVGQKMPFANSSFDCVVSSEALYYMRDPENFFAETWRVLRDGGRIVIITNNQLWHFLDGLRKILKVGPEDPLSSRLRLYYPSELRNMLRDSGFKHIHRECFGVIPLRGFGFLDRTPLRFFGHIILATGIKRQ